MKNYSIFLFFVVYCLTNAFADQRPHPLGSTPQIKEIVYNPNAIHTYTGFFGYQSSIVFEDGEIIGTISMGDSTAWQLNPQGNRLFLKPTDDNSTTNVTILTNKRVYHFVFRGKEAKDIDDPELSYEVRFRYPASSVSVQNTGMADMQGSDRVEPGLDIAKKDYLNFEYKLSGSDNIKPLKVFDDGHFTYMQFHSVNANLPAIFLVDSKGYESLVNYHISGKYLVIQQVASRFTLRHGDEYVCVFNTKLDSRKEHRKMKTTRTAGIFSHG
ncbi:P-type conjugative transfer protein VirB9 [Neorickettsia helminthoeca str. Oregon]|uniref:P-type conjugative transfer protein VirB9 n=1 Tax=Neorickettsia helminthoeca str. Oregon TaxID=1286528 RepID=X5H376_9RICK|nr:P-type conjugative transfer protein VirB9 [Neorickettsia helminthoeca]AHX11158.1 P-type conjugative transfer protein VirB9 [Neorickettsia helminthoeca str. Oregon]